MKQNNLTWQDAVLQCIQDLGGNATNQEIYDRIGNYYPLDENHWKISFKQYNFRHRVRATLTPLRRHHKIYSPKPGLNLLGTQEQNFVINDGGVNAQ